MKIKIYTTMAFRVQYLKDLADWFKEDIKFDVSAARFRPDWFISETKKGPVQRITRSWLKKFVDHKYDAVVFNMGYSQWKPTDCMGYTKSLLVNGQRFVAMKSLFNGKRKRNRGWLKDDEFIGRLRHELLHVKYFAARKKDNTHLYDYTEKKPEKCLLEF